MTEIEKDVMRVCIKGGLIERGNEDLVWWDCKSCARDMQRACSR